jgi:allophanate hydrolase
LLNVGAGQGHSIAVEVWALPAEGFGRFVAKIPPPLTIGTVNLTEFRHAKGFLVESQGVRDARDISEFGGWRKYVAQV